MDQPEPDPRDDATSCVPRVELSDMTMLGDGFLPDAAYSLEWVLDLRQQQPQGTNR